MANRRIAIVTHKGAAADSGHYVGYVKKSVFHANHGKPSVVSGESSSSAQKTYDHENDEDWYKFDDDKVSIFPVEKLTTLDGGGTSFPTVDAYCLNLCLQVRIHRHMYYCTGASH